MDDTIMENEKKDMEQSEECCNYLNNPCECYYAADPCDDGDMNCRMVIDPCCC